MVRFRELVSEESGGAAAPKWQIPGRRRGQAGLWGRPGRLMAARVLGTWQCSRALACQARLGLAIHLRTLGAAGVDPFSVLFGQKC